MEEVSCDAEVVLGGAAYLISVWTTAGSTLCVDVEHKQSGDHWKGEFSDRYVEEITAKTQNFKKFSVFVKMFMAGIRGESDSVSIELLTFADLEALKARKTRGASSRALPASAKASNKRYLIVTYLSEFDRVHYPLPLAFEDHPDPAALKGTICRLRQELESVQAGRGLDLRRENEALRARLNLLTKTYGTGALPAELERVKRERDQLAMALERLKSDSAKQIRNLARVCDQMERDIAAQREATARQPKQTQEMRQLKRQLARAQEDLTKSKKDAARKTREHTAALSELDKLRDSERKLRLKVRSLTSELDLTKRRSASSAPAYSPRAPSPRSRGSSRASSVQRERPGSSAPSSRASSRPSSRASSRASSVERQRERAERERPWATGMAKPRSRASSAERERPWQAGMAKPRSRASSAERRRPPSSKASSTKASPARSAAPSSSSAAAADPDLVRRKLDVYLHDQGAVYRGAAPGSEPEPEPEPLLAGDADMASEISQIDARLTALQDFLRAAKSGTPVRRK